VDTTPSERRYSALVEDVASPVVVAAPIACIECRRAWTSRGERWRLKVLLFEEEPAEAVPYCPECHAREFESN
jgi:hypothetical protein